MKKISLSIVTVIISILFIGPMQANPAEKESKYQCEKGSLYAVQLIFGLSSNDGKGVSEQQWDKFVKTSIDSRFPGSTTIDGLGRYHDNARKKEVVEKAKIVTLIIECNDTSDNGIKETVVEYKHQFKQKSVLRIDSVGQVISYE